MKQNTSMELSGQSFVKNYNRNGPKAPHRPQIKIFPDFPDSLKEFSKAYFNDVPKIQPLKYHAIHEIS